MARAPPPAPGFGPPRPPTASLLANGTTLYLFVFSSCCWRGGLKTPADGNKSCSFPSVMDKYIELIKRSAPLFIDLQIVVYVDVYYDFVCYVQY